MRDERLAARVRGNTAEASYGSSTVPLGQPGPAPGDVTPALSVSAEEPFDRAADELESRLEHLVAGGLEAMRACVPTWLSPAFSGWAQLDDRLLSSLRAELLYFRAGVLPGGLPAHDAFLVDVGAELGDLDALLGGYRYVQTSLWGAWFEILDRGEAESPVKRELLDRGSRFFLRYAELVGHYITESYRQRTEQTGSRAVRLASAPSASLLDGNPFADARRSFDFARHHLGVIVSGSAPQRTARSLAACLDRVAEIREHGTTWWVCLSGHEEISRRGMEELDAFVPEPGVGLAVGLEEFGEKGLCASFRQALWAQALAGEPAVTRYADIAVEALALRDEDEVRAFVGHELHGIDDDSATAGRMRATLAAYFACDLNAASAAAQLGVHHQTVANRLRSIESRLGRPLMGRTLELGLALRLRERMGT